MLKRAGDAPGELAGRLSSPLQAAHPSIPLPMRRPPIGAVEHSGECPEPYSPDSNRGSSSSKTITSGSYCIDLSGAGGGGRSCRSHSFRWRRIFSITGPSPIRLMILSGPEQRGQTRGSASYTFFTSLAHELLTWRRNSSAQPPSPLPGGSATAVGSETPAPARARRTLEKAGEGAVVADQLLSGIWDMGAQSGQEVQRREDAGRRGLGITAALALAAIVDDLAGFGAIAQTFESNRRMDHVAGQAPARLMVVRIDPLALIDGEARMPPIPHDFHQAGGRSFRVPAAP